MDIIRRNKYLFAFFAAMLLEFWFSMCAYSANHENYALAVGANLTYPFVNMLPIILMIEEQGWGNKARMAGITGAGYAVGTVIFLSAIKPHL